MMVTTINKIGAGRLLAAFTTPDTATGPPGSTLPCRDATNADARNGGLFQSLETTVARGEHAVSDFMRWLREGRVRRQTVRELRLMGRSRLADLGIDPDAIEHVADAMLDATASRSPRDSPEAESPMSCEAPLTDATASRSPRDSPEAESPMSCEAPLTDAAASRSPRDSPEAESPMSCEAPLTDATASRSPRDIR